MRATGAFVTRALGRVGGCPKQAVTHNTELIHQRAIGTTGRLPYESATRAHVVDTRPPMTLDVRPPTELDRPVTRIAALRVGVRSLTGGVGFIVKNPQNWPLAMVPIAVMLGLLAVTLTGTWFGSRAVAVSLMHLWNARSAWQYDLFRALALLAGGIASFVVAPALAQPLAGEALEALSRRQERALTGREWPSQKWFPQLLRSLRVTLTSLALGAPLLGLLTLVELMTGGIGSVVIEPVKFLIVSLMVAWDLLDYPLSVRAVAVRDRLAWMRARKWYVLGFGAACAALMVIPGVGLLLLPAGAAGATRLVLHLDAADGEAQRRP